ncbi:MAG: hypothetical protein ACO4AI_06100, partial [Prochlorothrix sp.]
MALNPQSFWKFFTVPTVVPPVTSSLSYYWDIQAYANLALQPQCSAFYPLWPTLIRLGFQPTTTLEAAQAFLQVATLLSVVAVPLILILFRQAFQNDRLALGMALLYSLSPLAIFRVIGYTESLFSLLGILLLLLLRWTPSPRLVPWIGIGVGMLAAFLALLRPTLPQMLSSSVATLLTLGGVTWAEHRNPARLNPPSPDLSFWEQFQRRCPLALPVTLALIIGTIVGYSLYGGFCWRTTGDFFGPFSQQSLWNKSLGFRPWLLFTSRSPLLDLWGLYLPPLLWLAALGQVGQALGYCQMPSLRGGLGGWILSLYPPLWMVVQTWGRSLGGTPSSPATPLPPWAGEYGVWFALYFAASHGAIVFLTQDRLVSLGRYIFAQPFVFLALGYLYPHLDRHHQRFLWPTLLGISSLHLLNQWVRYGYHQWLG